MYTRRKFIGSLQTLGSLNLWAWTIAVVAAAVYVFVYVYTPLVIMTWQSYDDSLFVKLGQYMATGQWLGPYDQFTLMKGPGYPFFLAISHWSGLPNTFTQALFFCMALGALALLTLKATKSRFMAVVVFVLPLLDPKTFEIDRTLRDCIYTSQSVLLFATFAYCLLVARTSRRRVISAVIAGVLFGWAWLTREEGVWLVPSLVAVAAFAFLRDRQLDGRRNWLSSSIIMVCTFVVINAIFATINWVDYGSFVGVDVKSSSFQTALSTLESVQVGVPISYVSVPRAARTQIYSVSPHFAKLRPYLDPTPGPSQWEAGGCMFHSSACGDIGTGFFMWAFRDAVAGVGAYKSPRQASAYYDAITREVRSACRAGRLRCEKRWIPYMPRMTAQQMGYIYGSIATLVRDVFTAGDDPKPRTQNVTGSEEKFRATLGFLNWPSHFPLYENKAVADVRVSGWFHNPSAGSSWFNLRVSDPQNESVPYNLIREASPDLVQSQRDPAATRQRFVLQTSCTSGCILHFSDEFGSKSFAASDSEEFYRKVTNLGDALLVFDSGVVAYPSRPARDLRVVSARRIRVGLYRIYNILLPALLSLGILTFFAMCYMTIQKHRYSFAFVVATACWLGVVVRSVILVLIDASSFQAMITPYLLPVYVLSVIASVLSLTAACEALSSVRHSLRDTQTFHV